MTTDLALRRVGVVVHPTRDTAIALSTVARWTEAHGLELVQLTADGTAQREVVAPGRVEAGDLVLALGGDGTVLAALRAAAGTNTPVLGVACGSVGALSAVAAGELAGALDRFREGEWTPRRLPALAIEAPGAALDWAANDLVLLRRGAGQLAIDVSVDEELYVRLAGDGVVVATPLGSSAYSMAAGGPVLAAGAEAIVCTPLAMHGGSGPPLVVPAGAILTIDVHPGFAGFYAEVDGQRRPLDDRRFRLGLEPGRLVLVTFGRAGHGLAGLRRRGLIADSPRVLARDTRATGPPLDSDGAPTGDGDIPA
jgi:NAD+ kinase